MGKVTVEYPDIQLDPGYFLTPEVAALYGLGPEATPNDVLNIIPGYVAVRMFRGWVNIFAYWTPGPVTWTAPDLFGNRLPYKVGVLVVGAGGSGAADSLNNYNGATGGASGHVVTDFIWVTPGQVISGVIGAGGEPVSTTGQANGNNGGASSFGGLVAEGGQGGRTANASAYIDAEGAIGGQCSSVCGCSCNPYGGLVVPMIDSKSTYDGLVMGKPLACYNPFQERAILGAGGWANAAENKVGTGGKDPYGTKFGGDGAIGKNTTVYGEYAHQGGCGGGAAATTNGATAVSGAGQVGYVEVYVQGVLSQ